MSSITILSYPKINLALDILGKTESGYHEIRTVFHQLGRAVARLSNQCAQRAQPLAAPVDELIIENSVYGSIEVSCDNPKVPLDKTNTVLKAALLLKKQFCISSGARIFIKKRIPLMSGLGGGASNAVAALKGLAAIWEIKCCALLRAPLSLRAQAKQSRLLRRYAPRNDRYFPNCFLYRLALQIGMDCPFFFDGGTALGEHFGENVTALPPLPKEIKFEIIETGVEVSSHNAYQWIDLKKCGKNIEKTAYLIQAIKNQDPKEILKNLHNDFEEFVFEKYPQLAQKKRKAEESVKSGELSRVILCGSGGCLAKVGIC